MPTSPNISGKRILVRKTGSGRSVPAGAKRKKEAAGTFEHAARRSDIVRDGKLRQSGLSACPECRSVFFDRHWHSASLVPGLPPLASLPPLLCDECRVKVKGSSATGQPFAGEIRLEGLADEEAAEVIRLARNVGKRAARRDPQDRVLKITKTGRSIRILTSENQLAVSIGKQIHRARKGGRLVITWSSDDKPVRVRWSASGKL